MGLNRQGRQGDKTKTGAILRLIERARSFFQHPASGGNLADGIVIQVVLFLTLGSCVLSFTNLLRKVRQQRCSKVRAVYLFYSLLPVAGFVLLFLGFVGRIRRAHSSPAHRRVPGSFLDYRRYRDCHRRLFQSDLFDFRSGCQNWKEAGVAVRTTISVLELSAFCRKISHP
jgi:hypothetical protein